MSKAIKPKEISFLMAIIPLLSMAILVIVGHLIYGVDLKFILLISAIIAGIIASISGVKVNQLFEAYSSTIKKAFPALLILISIGGIVGSWMYSGTVPFLIYYGLKFLHPDFVLVSTFLVTAVVSTFTGTSWGSAATAGVAFIGIGASVGIPLPMIAGAALSGAVFGDKVSPVSDTTNLCAMASDVTVYKHIRGMLPNVIISGIIATIGFLILGFANSGKAYESSEIELVMSNIDSLYNLNVFMLIPPAIVFIGGYKGYHPVVLMTISSLTAVAIGMIGNGFDLSDGANSMISGFNVEMIPSNALELPEGLLTLLNRGGFDGMLKGAVLYCILAIGFGAFMKVSGALDKLMNSLLKVIKSTYGLIVGAFAAGGILNAISGNAAFSILTVGQLFSQPFENRNIEKTVLSRSMENSMTLLESLLPWHVTAIYMSGVFDVKTIDYLPFAFFNIAGIVLFFVLSYFRKSIIRNEKRTVPS